MSKRKFAAVVAAALGAMSTVDASGVMLVVQSGVPRGAGSYDSFSGALISNSYLTTPGTTNTTPKSIASDGTFLYVADQLQSQVYKYTLGGSFVSTLLSTTQVNGPRGIAVSGGRLYVTCGGAINGNSGANVQSFALDGTNQQTFIPTLSSTNATPWSPFDIVIRGNDVLVSNFANAKSTNPTVADILSFPLTGGATATSFVQDPVGLSSSEQILVRSNGNIMVCGFNTAFGVVGTSGLYEYTSTGSFVRFLAVPTGPRGVAELGNGNFLYTDAGGVEELNPTTGVVTNISTVSSQYIISIPEPSGLLAMMPAIALIARRKR